MMRKAVSYGVQGHGQLPTHPAGEWYTDEAQPLTRQSFLDLLAGKIPVIRVPGFASKEVCDKLLAELTPKFCPYKNTAGPVLEKVGVAQFEFQAQAEEDYEKRKGDEQEKYFEEAAGFRSLHDDLAKAIGGENLWARVTSSLAALVPEWEAGVASEEDGRRYFSGIFRCINNGTPIHCDWCPYDCNTEKWILNRITSQAVFNLYISPINGGGTTVHDVQWTPEALGYRDPVSYGYHADLVESRKNCLFEPNVGDLFIFNSRNMHEVRPINQAYEAPGRVALASFMGVLPPQEESAKTKLMFWS